MRQVSELAPLDWVVHQQCSAPAAVAFGAFRVRTFTDEEEPDGLRTALDLPRRTGTTRLRHAGRMSRETPIADLRAESDHAIRRLALFRRRVYLGRADPKGLAEYERVAHGAAERLKRAQQRVEERSRRST